jgi:glycosyltransferase involved in cell wall biosynthesis
MHKNFLHLINTLDKGGTERILTNLLKDSPKHFNHHIVCLSGNGILAKEITDLGYEVTFLNLENKKRVFYSISKLIILCYKIKPKVINAWMYHSCLLSILLSFIYTFRATVVWNIRNANLNASLNPKTTIFIAKLNSFFSIFIKTIIYNSSFSKKLHSEIGYSNNKAKVLPNGFDCELFSPKNKKGLWKNKSENDICIGYISRYNAQKDPITFLEAAKIVVSKNANIHFLCFGIGLDDSNPDWKQKINELNLQNNIHSFGINKNTSQWYREFDFFTLSSVGESFPNVIGEALASGIPIIATDAGDIKDIIENCGYCIKPKNPKLLAETWLKAINLDSKSKKKLALNCRKKALNCYDSKKINKSYWTFFD